MQSSTQTALQEKGLMTLVNIGNFFDEVIASKFEKKQTVTINADKNLYDTDILVLSGVENDLLNELIDEETTHVDMGLVLRELQTRSEDEAAEVHHNEIVLKGCPYATRGLSCADFH